MFSQIDEILENDVDVIKKFLSSTTFSEYMLIPGQNMRPDGVYVHKLGDSHIDYFTHKY